MGDFKVLNELKAEILKSLPRAYKKALKKQNAAMLKALTDLLKFTQQ